MRISRVEYIAAIDRRCDLALTEYEKTAPVVYSWIESVYANVTNGEATLRDLLMLEALLEDGVWMHPLTASNRVYRHLHTSGKDTTGMAGF